MCVMFLFIWLDFFMVLLCFLGVFLLFVYVCISVHVVLFCQHL